MLLRQSGMLGEQDLGGGARRLQEVFILIEVGKTKERRTALAGAEVFPRAAHEQVLARDGEAVGVLEDDLEPSPSGVAERALIEEHARRLGAAASDSPAQLMQLRKTEALSVLDDHQRRVRDVHSNLDDRRPHQEVDSSRLELRHGERLFLRLEAPVNQPHAELWKLPAERSVRVQRRLQLQTLRLLDQGANPVGLPSRAAGFAYAPQDLCTLRLRK